MNNMSQTNGKGIMEENVVLDLETTGIDPGCMILSIGACTLDGKEKFYQTIAADSGVPYNLRDNIETLRWWYKQDSAVREEAFSGTKGLVEVLDMFHDWFRTLNGGDYKNTFIWGNGSSFDISILQYAYRAVERPLPWAGKNDRCFRTFRKLMPHIKGPPRATVMHHALYDAEYEAEYLRLLMAVL